MAEYRRIHTEDLGRVKLSSRLSVAFNKKPDYNHELRVFHEESQSGSRQVKPGEKLVHTLRVGEYLVTEHKAANKRFHETPIGEHTIKVEFRPRRGKPHCYVGQATFEKGYVAKYPQFRGGIDLQMARSRGRRKNALESTILGIMAQKSGLVTSGETTHAGNVIFKRKREKTKKTSRGGKKPTKRTKGTKRTRNHAKAQRKRGAKRKIR